VFLALAMFKMGPWGSKMGGTVEQKAQRSPNGDKAMVESLDRWLEQVLGTSKYGNRCASPIRVPRLIPIKRGGQHQQEQWQHGDAMGTVVTPMLQRCYVELGALYCCGLVLGSW
jgi:hypothetical protein